MLLRHVVNLSVVGLGLLALPFGIWLFLTHRVTTADVAIFLVMYVSTGLGITMGYHRLFSHRSFQARPWLRYSLAMLGSAAAQGPVIEWVADHRKHHAFSDRTGDPHSPHVDRGAGLLGLWMGYWHSHMGWLFRNQGLADEKAYASDLLEDATLVSIEHYNTLFIGLSFMISFGVGYWAGSWHGAITGLFWGGLFRYGLFQQALFTVNAMGHLAGQRPYRTTDRSCNVGWMALPALGDAWHCNHHTFPTSAVIQFRWWQLDLTGFAIRVLEALGLVWNVKEVPIEIRERFAVKRTSTTSVA
jgi:stearoyl-CoA desaturase (delta-9 desaturase)